ncbi:hypothetical protein AMECASPLE_000424 [Ameca splendens]|uniref:Uncharacterized protein n=1 Tax=Ameca splendens TaxID=208324 RepID=A0ABV0YWA5_9TELE
MFPDPNVIPGNITIPLVSPLVLGWVRLTRHCKESKGDGTHLSSTPQSSLRDPVTAETDFTKRGVGGEGRMTPPIFFRNRSAEGGTPRMGLTAASQKMCNAQKVGGTMPLLQDNRSIMRNGMEFDPL